MDDYLTATNKGFTTNLDLWLIRPNANFNTDNPDFECILVSDNDNMYDPLTEYTGTIPDATDNGW